MAAVKSTPVSNHEDDANLWSSILNSVRLSSARKLPAKKALLVLGENESGKTTLIAKLRGLPEPKKGTGLEYYYIDVRDEYRDDHTRLGAYILDGDVSHAHLLKYTLPPTAMDNTTVILTAAMNTPWNIIDSLDTWTQILGNHINRLSIPPNQQHERQQSLLRRWLDYIEPGDEIDGTTAAALRKSSTSVPSDLDDVNLGALPEGTLLDNLGLDIVVVITKTDYMSNLEKDCDYKDEHFDFIQQSIRKFCLRFGAALFYISVKEDKNCDLFYKYLVHRIYGFPFKTPALVVEKDAVFVPSGWDNDKKISILYENMSSMRPDDMYSDVICKPVHNRKPLQRDLEIQAEDDQVFLSRLLANMNQQNPASGAGRTPGSDGNRPPFGVQKIPDRRLSGSPGVNVGTGSPTKKMDGTKVGMSGTSEGVLANFFNSLLNKKAGASPQSAGVKTEITTPEKPFAMNRDPAAELERLARVKKPSSPSSNNTSPNPNSGQNNVSNNSSPPPS